MFEGLLKRRLAKLIIQSQAAFEKAIAIYNILGKDLRQQTKFNPIYNDIPVYQPLPD